jgi:hypothetical protein
MPKQVVFIKIYRQMQHTFIENLKLEIEPVRQEIIRHAVYSAIKTPEDLNIFMQYHVFAVWDFMSLLKSLQRELTCIDVPWFPRGSANTRFLINEIVVGEESDVDRAGIRKSHYEMYLDAMEKSGADTACIHNFTQHLAEGKSLEEAIKKAKVPGEAAEFTEFTFSVINSGKTFLQSAIFTFGREDLIPDMFLAIVKDMHHEAPDKIADFKYYLERHIEVDGDHHSHLAIEMTAELCGSDIENWKEATNLVKTSLLKRKILWDGALKSIQNHRISADKIQLQQ